jgi:hypothetical protein
VSSSPHESSGHGAYFDRGAVVAAVGAVSLVAPALAVGGVALVGKMAADSAMKTLDGIATDSSSKVVKQISSDLAKDVVDPKMLSDNPAATHTEVTVDTKVTITANEGEATTAKVNLQASAINDTDHAATTVMAVTTTKLAVATPESVTSNEMPVTANAAKSMSNSTFGNSVDQKSDTPMILDPSGHPAVTAAVAVAYKPPNTPTPSTAAPLATVPPPVVTPSQGPTTTSAATHPPGSDQDPHSTSDKATILAGGMAGESLTHLPQGTHSTTDRMFWRVFSLINSE